MHIDQGALFEIFFAESSEHLSRIEESLLALESQPDDRACIDALFRTVHTLKGNANALSLQSLTELAHAFEELLYVLRQGETTTTPALVTLMLEALDGLRAELQSAGPGRNAGEVPGRAALIARLNAAASRDEAAAKDPADRGSKAECSDAESRLHEITQESTLRVGVTKLDRLLDLTGEILLARDRQMQLLRTSTRREGLIASHIDADRLYAELQETVMRLRTVPIGPMLQSHGRTVRDLAAAQGKCARLEVLGGGVEVDMSVVAPVHDALVHLIRNAIDHGLEPPEVRSASGKDPCGTLSLRAFHADGILSIELRDDGAGFNTRRILERARALGLLEGDAVPTEQEILELVFRPGFSTADAVTELSGRGVGMDVVRHNLQALRGSVRVTNEPGRGATVTLCLPLTVAIIDGFGVGIGSETYVLPLEAVQECLAVPERVKGEHRAMEVLDMRGQPLPCLWLREVMGAKAQQAPNETVVVLHHGGKHVGLVVDHLFGKSQTVIKPLGPLFAGTTGIAGSTILGTGRVALVLDVAGLIAQGDQTTQGRRGEKSTPPAHAPRGLSAPSECQVVSFVASGRALGIDTARVREVIELPEVTRVPGADSMLLGVINMRGTIVPAIDLAYGAAQTPAAPASRRCAVLANVSVGAQPLAVAIIADQIRDVVTVRGEDLRDVPDLVSTAYANNIAAMGRVSDGFVAILDVDHLVASLLDAHATDHAIARVGMS